MQHHGQEQCRRQRRVQREGVYVWNLFHKSLTAVQEQPKRSNCTLQVYFNKLSDILTLRVWDDDTASDDMLGERQVACARMPATTNGKSIPVPLNGLDCIAD